MGRPVSWMIVSEPNLVFKAAYRSAIRWQKKTDHENPIGSTSAMGEAIVSHSSLNPSRTRPVRPTSLARTAG